MASFSRIGEGTEAHETVSARESGPPAGPIVDVNWLTEALNSPGIRVVDARPAERYLAGHILGAVNADLYALSMAASDPPSVADFVERARAELRRIGVRQGERVVFYEDVSGTAAARGVWMLDFLGVAGAAMLDGGLAAWRRAGGAITRDLPDLAPGDLVVRPDLDLLATADEIAAGLGVDPPPVRLLDTRNDLEWAGGTIPSSVHLEWIRHLDEAGAFRPLADLRALYAGIGFDPADRRPVATFCASGYRAAHTYVVLKALGFPRLKNYVPSWGEWSRRAGLPVARPRRG